MTSEDWRRLQAAFDRVLETPPEQRQAAVDEVCDGDAVLRAEIESLLWHEAHAGDAFLASPAPSRSVDVVLDEWAARLLDKKIGRCTLGRLIAAGGMGCVFEASQDQPARKVALKILRPGLNASKALSRFRLESEVLGRLRHPNVAQVYEAGMHVDDGACIPYFVMELIHDAFPLIEYADRRGLTTEQRLELFAKVCDAVQHGHQKGVIHRDLKPENILVGRDGEPKVIDFGVARAVDSDVMITTQCTRTGDIVGTVRYMSPEQCDGDSGLIDTRSDIYSLGVVAYELLTGAAPYDASDSTLYAAIRVIKEEPPRRPSAVNRRFRGDVEAILLKALEKDPARRYASAAALAQDIRRHLVGESIEARPPGLADRFMRWTMRRPALVTGSLCVIMLTVAAAASALTYWYSSMHPCRIVLSDDRSVAQLLSPSGGLLTIWRGGREGGISFAELLPAPAAPSGGPLAIIGYQWYAVSEHKSSLALYDLDIDRDEPYTDLHLADSDIPVEEIKSRRREDGRVFSARAFGACQALLADIFPDPDGCDAPELAVIFKHGDVTHSAICIYRIDGTLLYRGWVDAFIQAIYWIPKTRLLVFAGVNGAAPLHERMIENPPKSMFYHPKVVFAVRPELNLILPDKLLSLSSYIEQEPDLRDSALPALRPVWYYCIHPYTEQYHRACILENEVTLQRPAWYSVDSDRAVLFTVSNPYIIKSNPILQYTPRSWIISGEEGVVSDVEIGEVYQRLLQSPEDLEEPLLPYDYWSLGDLPPIKPTDASPQ